MQLLVACAVEQGQVQRAPERASVQPPIAPPAVPVAPPATTTVPPASPPLVIRIPAPPPGGFPKSLAESGASPAAQALVKQAQDARAANKNDVALGLLERALRIEPRNAFIWQAVADTKLALGNAGDAEAAAQKSSSLARGNPWVDSGNWRLIAAARAALGDGAGARLANSRADGLTASLSSPPATAP
jgi:tetratricopeptide (TPR) repeat protein